MARVTAIDKFVRTLSASVFSRFLPQTPEDPEAVVRLGMGRCIG